MSKIKSFVTAVAVSLLGMSVVAGGTPLSIESHTITASGTEMESYSTTLYAGGGTSPYSWSAGAQGVTKETSSTWNTYKGSGEPQTGWIRDDDMWPLALPFEFPFYGEVFTNIWISSNGNIYFENGATQSDKPKNHIISEYNYSENTLSNNKMLAVYWQDGGTDTYRYIYTDVDESRAIIRFDHSDRSSGINKAAAVLTPDGLITVVYGDAECNAQECATGISAGNGVDYIYDTHSAGTMCGANNLVYYTGSKIPGVTMEAATGIYSGNPTTAGTYFPVFTVTDDAGGQVAAKMENAVVIAENMSPKPVVTAFSPADYSSIAVGNSQTFSVTTEGATSYRWFVDGVEQIGKTGSSFEYISNGSDVDAHKVKVFINGGVWQDVDVSSFTWNFRVGNCWYVSAESGNDSNAGDYSHRFKTLKKAASVARDGDVVYVDDGIYRERLIIGYSVRFESLSGDPESCIIDAERLGRCVDGVSSADWGESVFVGFTFRNGYVGNNDGGCVINGKYIDCIITGGYAGDCGGGAANADLERCRVYGNSSRFVGGVASSRDCVIRDSVIYGNAGNNYAGGIRASSDATVRVFNSIVTGNVCESGPACNDIGAGVEVDGLSFVSGDAKLFFPEAGDFCLREGSPCLKDPVDNNVGWYKGYAKSGYGVKVVVEGKCEDVTINGVPGGYCAVGAGVVAALQACADANHSIDGWYDESGTRISTAAMVDVPNVSGNRIITLRMNPGEYYVDVTTGNDANNGADSDHAMKTIQAAINAAGEGDIVKVAEGTYPEHLDTVRGERVLKITIEATGSRDATVVDGGASGRCLVAAVVNSVTTDTVVKGLTLRNGEIDGENGGGAYGGWLIGCKVTGCVADGGNGGGISCCRADRCEISNNHLVNCVSGNFYGAGAYRSDLYDCLVCGNQIDDSCTSSCDGAGVAYRSNVYNCTITGNRNDSPGGEGAGLDLYSGSCYNSIIYGNYIGANPDDTVDSLGQGTYVNSITEDPHFTNAAAGDYTLLADSCAVDAGLEKYRVSVLDLNGRARSQGRALDLGCYESTPVPNVANQDFAVADGDSLDGQIVALLGTGEKTFTYDVDDKYAVYESAHVYEPATGERESEITSDGGYFNLPFEFEYDGEKFDRVWVNRYGGISFTVTDDQNEQYRGYSMTWDSITNEGYRAIIPFCDYLSYSGQNEGVFVTTNGTEAVFRWISDVYDISCALNADGTIKIAYGKYPYEFLNSDNRNQCGLVFKDKSSIYINGRITSDVSLAPVFTFRPMSMPDAGEVTLGSDGRVTGTPSHYGEYLFKVNVEDEAGHKNYAYVSVNVDISYTLSFAKNNADATGSVPEDKRLTYAETYVLPNTVPELAGSEFLGWATNSAGAVVYHPGDVVSKLTDEQDATVSLYAVWKLVVATAALPPANGNTAYDFQPVIIGGGRPLDCMMQLVSSNYNPVVRQANSFAVVGESTGWTGDTFDKEVDLPFVFRFYDDEYEKVTVGADGYLYFGPSCSIAYNNRDEDVIKTNKVIAVYACDHNVTAGRPVRIASTSDSFTVCWTTYRYNSSESLINASCTLGKDGSIVLKYGEGNNYAENVTIGISAGDGVRYVYKSIGHSECANMQDMVFAYPDLSGFSVDGATGRISCAEPSPAGDYPVRYVVAAADGQSVVSNYVLSITTSYQVRFNANGGEGSMSNQDFTWNVPAALTANVFTREGSTFLGWTTAAGDDVVYADGEIVKNLTDVHNGVINLYAVWSVKVSEAALPPIRAGEEYEGALTAAGGSGSYTWSTTNSLPSGVTLKPDGTFTGSPLKGGVFDICFVATDAYGNKGEQWFSLTSKTDYVVHFHENGGTGTMADQWFVWGDEPKALSTNAFTKGVGEDRWDFVGWDLYNWGDSIVYTNGQKIANVNDSQDGYIDLWAKWHPGYYTIHFDTTGAEDNFDQLTNIAVEVNKWLYFPSQKPSRYGWTFSGWSRQPNPTSYDYSAGGYHNPGEKRDTILNLYMCWGRQYQYEYGEINGNVCCFEFYGDNLLVSPFAVTNGASVLTMPAEFLGHPVTGFKCHLLTANTNVVRLVFSEGLTGIYSEEAFYDMRALEEVVFPSSFTNIANSAFYSCSKLRTAELNEGLQFVGQYAFYNTAITAIEIPSTVDTIGRYAFYNVIRTVFKGDVQTAGENAFCESRNVRFEGNATSWIGDSVFYIGNGSNGYIKNIQYLPAYAASWEGVSLSGCRVSEAKLVVGEDGNEWYWRDDGDTAALVSAKSASGAVTLPATAGGKPVTVIADAFLAGNENVSSIVIPAGVTNVEDYAFYKMPNLRTIYVTGDGCKVVSSTKVYQGSPIEHVYYLPQHAGKWSGQTLFGVAMEAWPTGDMWTAKFAGNGSTDSMDDVAYVSGYEYALPINTFRKHGFKFVKWTSDEETPADYDNEAVPAAQTPGSVVTFTAQWTAAYMYTVDFDMNGGKVEAKPATVDLEVSLEDTTVLPSLSDTDRAGSWQFLGWSTNSCATVAELAAGEEYRNGGLSADETITLYAVWQPKESVREWVDDLENGNRFWCCLYGDEARIYSYEVNSGTPTKIVIPEEYLGFKVRALFAYMQYKTAVTEVYIPLTITNCIGQAFYGCSGVTNIVFTGALDGPFSTYNVFSNMSGLESVTIPEGITDLGGEMFYSCSSLKHVTLPSTLTNIGNYCFYGCPIEKLELPAGLVLENNRCLGIVARLRFLGDVPSSISKIFNGVQSSDALKLLEYPATNTTWNSCDFHTLTNTYCTSATVKAFVGPVAIGVAEKCYFWKTGDGKVNFAYAEDTLPAEFSLPAVVTWGGVNWSVDDVESDAFDGQPTTTLRYPATWAQRMYGVTSYPAGITSMIPAGEYSTVTFNANGGTGTMAPFLVPDGATVVLPFCTITKSQNIFRGWNTATSDHYENCAEYTGAGTEPVTLYASWEFVGEYTLKYVTGAPYVDPPADKQIAVGDTQLLATNVLVRTGWTFDGWTNSVGTVYAPGGEFSSATAKDQTTYLYAKWTKTSGSSSWTDGNGTVWNYGYSGDNLYIQSVIPGPGVTELPNPLNLVIRGTKVTSVNTNVIPVYSNGLWWYCTTDSSGANITSVRGSLPNDVIVPNQLGGKDVVSTGWKAFDDASNYTNVFNITLPEHIVSLGYYDFSYFYNLNEVEFPETLEFEGNTKMAFHKAGYYRGYDDAGIRYADTEHIFVSGLDRTKTSIVVPEGVKVIGYDVFTYIGSTPADNTTELTLPSTLEVIAMRAFQIATKITKLTVKNTLEPAYESGQPISFSVTDLHFDCADVPTNWVHTIKNHYTGVERVYYPATLADEWADYIAANPTIEFIPEGKFTLAFDANGGTVATSEKTVDYNAAIGEMPAPERNGYEFAGWKIGETDVTSGTIYGWTEDKTAVAQWIARTYTFGFNANGGSGVMDDMTNLFCTVATNLNECTYARDGYVFAGWALTADGGIAYYDCGEYSPSESDAGTKITLYAKWRKIADNCYAVVIDDRSGNAPVVLDWKRNTVYNIPAVTPQPMKKFAGWKGSDGKRYDGGILVFNLAEIGKFLKLTAIWK